MDQETDYAYCMNCGALLVGEYCHECGQKDDDFRRPFWSLGNEFFAEMFQWDSRFARSIVPFLFMPGNMDRAFFIGRRGLYVTPLRLYFVISLVFFLTLAFNNIAIMQVEVHGLADVVKRNASVDASPDEEGVRRVLQRRLEDIGAAITGEDTDVSISMRMFTRLEERDSQDSEILPAEDVRDLIGEDSEGSEEDIDRVVKAFNLAVSDPRIFNTIMNIWLPRVMIVLVPLFAVFLRVLYGRRKTLKRRIFFIDHLVFSIHFHAFIFMLMILLVLKARWVGELVDGTPTMWFFLTAISLYLFVGMKRVYGQGFIKTGFKFVALATLTAIVYISVLTSIATYALLGMADRVG